VPALRADHSHWPRSAWRTFLREAARQATALQPELHRLRTSVTRLQRRAERAASTDRPATTACLRSSRTFRTSTACNTRSRCRKARHRFVRRGGDDHDPLSPGAAARRRPRADRRIPGLRWVAMERDRDPHQAEWCRQISTPRSKPTNEQPVPGSRLIGPN
jgi:hypothetical protein